MHEKIQEVMTYVRNFGRSNLFITFTFNLGLSETNSELFPD